ncbi:hypothetical protein KR222_000707 [Zaprionus bogoriensis]|nr:hypothetical protein KR222_000707 [Zaprionus bogoriensis]
MRTRNSAKKPERVAKKHTLQCPPRQIPKQVLARTLEILNDPKDEFWLNKSTSCVPPINYGSTEIKHSDTVKKLNIARKCLMTRDWQNLAKLLTSNLIGDSILQKGSFPLFLDVS